MGDRGNIVIVQHADGTVESGSIYLYSHWGGSSLGRVLQCALLRGRDRWGDEPYLGRIIFNQMTAGAELETTGFGLGTYLTDNEHDLFIVDASKETVAVQPPGGKVTATFTFAEFASRDLVAAHLTEENFPCPTAPAGTLAQVEAAPPPERPTPTPGEAFTFAVAGAVAAVLVMRLVRKG